MVTDRVRSALVAEFGVDKVTQLAPIPASEDFSVIPDAFGIPYCYWGFGGFVEGTTPVPKHNPGFGPVVQPTLATGTAAAVAAASAFLESR